MASPLRSIGFGLAAALAALAVASGPAQTSGQTQTSGQSQGGTQESQGFRFKSGVELINVTATVTDASGRFVPGLRQDDFVVYEDDQPMTVTHFSADRV